MHMEYFKMVALRAYQAPDALRKMQGWLSALSLSNIDSNSVMKKLSHKSRKTRIYNTFAAYKAFLSKLHLHRHYW